MTDLRVCTVERSQAPPRSPPRARRLSTPDTLLPHATTLPRRRWWRQPTLLGAVGLAALAGLGLGGWLLAEPLLRPAVAATHLTWEHDADNGHLHWTGPDTAYVLFAVHPNRATVDLTAFIRGQEAWLPAAAKLYEGGTCFIVRPATVTSPLTTDATTLQPQGGTVTCIDTSIG